MTPSSAAQRKFVKGAFTASRPAGTLAHLMEEAQRLEIGQRITQLRERSPFTQPNVAEKLGITLRAYQKLEAKGTTHFDRCEELAEIHKEWRKRDPEWRDRDANWLWDGRLRGDKDLIGALGAASEPDPAKRLEDRVAEQEDHLEARIESQGARLLAEISLVRDVLEQQQQLLEQLLRGQEEDQP